MEGRYEEGVGNITWVIETSRRLGRVDYTLAGYKQLIFYFIQIDDADGMKQNLDLALDLAVQENNHREIGVLLRLQGLYHMMTGNYEQAEKRLLESINALTVTESMARSYTVNIAASYNYIGEILMEKEDYVQALPMFSKAISLCPGNVFSSLSVFYINAGKASFFQPGTTPQPRHFWRRQLALYGQFDSFWRRPTMNSYLAADAGKKQEPVRRPTASSRRAEIYVADEEPQRPGFRLFLPGPDPRLGGPGSGGGPFF